MQAGTPDSFHGGSTSSADSSPADPNAADHTTSPPRLSPPSKKRKLQMGIPQARADLQLVDAYASNSDVRRCTVTAEESSVTAKNDIGEVRGSLKSPRSHKVAGSAEIRVPAPLTSRPGRQSSWQSSVAGVSSKRASKAASTTGISFVIGDSAASSPSLDGNIPAKLPGQPTVDAEDLPLIENCHKSAMISSLSALLMELQLIKQTNAQYSNVIQALVNQMQSLCNRIDLLLATNRPNPSPMETAKKQAVMNENPWVLRHNSSVTSSSTPYRPGFVSPTSIDDLSPSIINDEGLEDEVNSIISDMMSDASTSGHHVPYASQSGSTAAAVPSALSADYHYQSQHSSHQQPRQVDYTSQPLVQLPIAFEQRDKKTMENTVVKWVDCGFSEYLAIPDFLHKFRDKIPVTESGITKMGLLLARHHFFGERVLSISTLSGREEKKLDPDKLIQLKKVLRSLTPEEKVNSLDFEKQWGVFRTSSLTHLCKKLRQQVVKYDLKQKALQLHNSGM